MSSVQAWRLWECRTLVRSVTDINFRHGQSSSTAVNRRSAILFCAVARRVGFATRGEGPGPTHPASPKLADKYWYGGIRKAGFPEYYVRATPAFRESVPISALT